MLLAEAELLGSERVSIAALRLLGLQSDPALSNKWKESTDGRGEFESWVAGAAVKKLDVKPSRDVERAHRCRLPRRIPRLLRRTVNAFVKAYVDITNELREETAVQSSDSIGGRTKRLKAALASPKKDWPGV